MPGAEYEPVTEQAAVCRPEGYMGRGLGIEEHQRGLPGGWGIGAGRWGGHHSRKVSGGGFSAQGAAEASWCP